MGFLAILEDAEQKRIAAENAAVLKAERRNRPCADRFTAQDLDAFTCRSYCGGPSCDGSSGQCRYPWCPFL